MSPAAAALPVTSPDATALSAPTAPGGRPLGVLMVSDVYFPRVNGVSTSIQTFRRSLVELGHRCPLIAPEYPQQAPSGPEPGVQRVRSWRVPLDPEDRLMSRRDSVTAGLALRGQVDLVHVQTPFVAHRVGLELGRRLGVPVVETYHTFFEEYLHNYVPQLPSAWLRSLARGFSRRQCNRLSGLVVPSGPMLARLREYGIATTAEVIPTGLDLSPFRQGGDGAGFRRRLGIPPGRPLLLYVGRVAHEKNIDGLLDMLALLRREHPDVLLLIAGEGPAEGHLRARVGREGLQGQVRFIGYLDRRRELLDCYASADVFVFASRTETQGLVLIEAMAMGLPVVALAEMGTRDVLHEGQGACIAPDDAAGFAARVAELLVDPQRRQVLGAAARACAEGWEAMGPARRLEAFYRRLLGEAAQAPA